MNSYDDRMKKFILKILFTMIIFLLIITDVFSQEDLVKKFREENGNEWQIALGPWDYIIVAKRDFPAIKGENVTENQAKEIAENFLTKNAAFFGVESFIFIQSNFIWTESEEYWMFGYNGKTFEGKIPPQIIIKILMTKDGQVYAMGDEDMFGGEPPEFEPPVTKSDAVKTAQEGTGSDKEPSDANAIKDYPLNETDSRRVWNITFGQPENKEVIVDATTGEILSIKSTTPKFDFNKISEFFKNPYSIVSIVLIVIAIIGIILFKRSNISSFDKLKIKTNSF